MLALLGWTIWVGLPRVVYLSCVIGVALPGLDDPCWNI